MKKWDIFIVRFLPFVLYIIFVMNVVLVCSDHEPFISYELHGNSAIYALAFFVVSLMNKRYHCVWNRAMYAFLVFVPTMNYIDEKFAVFGEYEVYLWVMAISSILTAITTAYLAIRHFVQISKRGVERGRE